VFVGNSRANNFDTYSQPQDLNIPVSNSIQITFIAEIQMFDARKKQETCSRAARRVDC
jgi:hypothetical protein